MPHREFLYRPQKTGYGVTLSHHLCQFLHFFRTFQCKFSRQYPIYNAVIFEDNFTNLTLLKEKSRWNLRGLHGCLIYPKRPPKVLGPSGTYLCGLSSLKKLKKLFYNEMQFNDSSVHRHQSESRTISQSII